MRKAMTAQRRLGLAVALAVVSYGALAQSGDLAEGEVRKVDRPAAKVTLKHGEIRNLDMPPMTMVFVVRDPAALDALKAGDKVQFRAIKDGGTYTVTEIRKMGP